jgi:hypothetical protein
VPLGSRIAASGKQICIKLSEKRVNESVLASHSFTHHIQTSFCLLNSVRFRIASPIHPFTYLIFHFLIVSLSVLSVEWRSIDRSICAPFFILPISHLPACSHPPAFFFLHLKGRHKGGIISCTTSHYITHISTYCSLIVNPNRNITP